MKRKRSRSNVPNASPPPPPRRSTRQRRATTTPPSTHPQSPLSAEKVAKELHGTRYSTLQTYRHQVAGQLPLLWSKMGVLCKIFIAKEFEFYASVHVRVPGLVEFTPRFYGSVNLITSEEKQNFFQHDAAPRKTSHPSQSNTRVEGPVTEQKTRRTATTIPMRSLFDEFSWSRQKKRRKFQTMRGKESLFTVLEDIALPFHRPCILDAKLGTRQHGLHAPPAKVASKTKRCRDTTSMPLGLRICGMQVFHHESETYVVKDKYFGRSLDVEGFKHALWQFVASNMRDMETIQRRVMGLRTRLQRLEAVLTTSVAQHRFYSCSLLLMYEAVESDESSDTMVDVRLVDFAHYEYRHDEHEGRALPDDGVLFGILSLIRLLKELEERTRKV